MFDKTNLVRYCLFLLSILPAMLFAQEHVHTMTGYVRLKNGPEYRYKIVYRVAGSDISGYSVTEIDKGIEMRTSIKGIIDREQHIFNFRELKKTSSSADGICYFNVKMRWQVSGGRYLISGVFTGIDNNNDPCLGGAISFDVPVKKATALAVTEKENGDPDIITAAAHKIFDWQTDTCTMQLWDDKIVDGDIVTILLNGKNVLDDYMLTGTRKQLVLAVRNKTNIIAVVARNAGKAPPNTSQILLYDGNIAYPVISVLKAGDTATIVIRKK